MLKYDATEARHVDRIDPRLNYIGTFEKGRGVNLVQYGRELYVLKSADSSLRGRSLEVDNNHLEVELEALATARDVGDITHLVWDYGFINGGRAILKEYVVGRDLNYFSASELNDSAVKRLVLTVMQLHSLGLSANDPKNDNFVFNKETNRILIVDFDCSITQGMEGFEKAKEEEIRFLRKLQVPPVSLSKL